MRARGRWLVCASVACGPPSGSGLEETSSTASSAGSSSATSTSADSTTVHDQEDGNESVKFDYPPEVPACVASDVTQIDLDVSSPLGEIKAMHAWWGWQHCCAPHPWILLSEIAPAGGCLPFDFERPALSIETRSVFPPPIVWSGATEAKVMLCVDDPHDCAEFDISFEIIEPLTAPDYPSDVEQPPLRASFDVAQDGWVLSGSLAASHCPGLDCGPCPCE